MSSLSVSASQFKVIEASLDIKLIIPVLEDLGLLSLSDKENLVEKSQKQAVKFILRNVRQHSEGLKLFHDVLEKTKANVGHQKVLQVLYPTEDLELQADDVKESGSSNSGSYFDSHQASNFATRSTSGHSVQSSKSPLSSDQHSEVFATKIKVHFTYDELEFPKIIQAGTYSEFYTKVISALSSKKPGSKASHLQYEVGIKWYDFNKDTGFEELCMDENNPEISIKAISAAADFLLSDSDKASVPMQLSGEFEQNQKVSFQERLVKPSDTLSSPTVEDNKDIGEKAMLKNTIESAMLYLERSLAIIIKSVTSRLCGTKATLHKLHEVNSQLQCLPEGSAKASELKAELNELVYNSCKFWNGNCSETEDWVWHCRKVLPRKGNDPQQEWKDLSEDLKSWKLDISLKFINRASFKVVEHTKFKLVNRLKPDDLHLFSSKHICFKTDSYQEYKLVEFADKAIKVRNRYAHLSSLTGIIDNYLQDFKTIEKFSVELLQWVKLEDGNPQYVSVCQDNVAQIQQKYESYLVKYYAKWDSVYDGLKKFNFNHFGYILISTPCSTRAGVLISKVELAKLNNIPWSAIVDFDVASRQDGLWDSLCEKEGGQYRLASFQSPSKNTVVPFSYADINSADRSELNRDGHIPWIFPHGEVQDQNNKACPFKDHQQYCTVVRKPLVNSMRKIASHLVQNRCQGVVGVVLCYGDYGYQSENLPYSNFLSDLKHLCNILADEGSSIIVLSDSPFLARYLKPLPVFIFPLAFFCKTIKSKLTFVQDELPPVNMPSLVGPHQVTFDEEDLELVHEYIAEHELHSHKIQKMIEMQQGDKKVPESTTQIDHDIKCELRERFYKGQQVTWISLGADDAITRKEESEIMKGVRNMLLERVTECKEPGKYVIYHFGGAGATTLARKIVWNFRKEFPCVLLKLNYKYTDRKVECTSKALKALYEELRYPVLMLIDEEPFFKAIPRLTGYVQASGTPVVFLQVQRVELSEPRSSVEQTVKCTESSWVLPHTVHKEDASKLKYKLSMAFGENKIFAGDRRVAEMKSSMVTPNENDQVTDLKQNGIITKILTKKKNKLLPSYHLVKVDWGDGNEEICTIGSFVNQANTSSYKSVYLNTEISRVYETFHFYGIMYLDEEFREPMREHIKKCLNEMLPCLQRKDDVFKDKLLILAYVSMLFAFKVCESIHIKAFEYLCYAVTNTSAPKEFKLETYIPETALRFMIITREGQFRIIHPIVAYEIIEFHSRNSLYHYVFPPSFVCDFLNYMLPEREYQNEEAALDVNRLLRYREYVDDGKGNLTKKQFSELILKLDKQDPQHAVEVLHYASKLIDNCHAYGHYARYMSKKIQDYDEALEILKEAEKRAFKHHDEGVVLNIKGDVYREKLEKYLKQNENLDWKDSNNKAYELHFYACEAYQEAYKKHRDDFPLFNELAVRLNLLETIKKCTKTNEHQFLKLVHGIPDAEVSKSIDTCLQLVKDLNEYVCAGDGRKNFDDYSDEARLKKFENSLHSIMGSKEKQKKILYDLMTDTKYATHVNLPNIRRSYIHLCDLESTPIQTDMEICLKHLENNFDSEGHLDQDMMNWLLIIRNLPYIGIDTKKIEKRLISWRNQGPCLVNARRNIQAKNNPLWVNFYLTICYFIQLIEIKEEGEIPCIVQKFKDAHHELLHLSVNTRSRLKIKEWLYNTGSGFIQLKSGQPIQGKMLLLKGSAGIPSLQEAQRSRGDKGYPYVSWKGLCIPLWTKRSFNFSFKQGDIVNFGMGFTLSGPQAIVIEESAVAIPTNPLAEENKQTFHQESIIQTHDHFLTTKDTSVIHEHKPKQHQQKKKKQKR